VNCIHIRFVTRQRCGEFYPTSRLYVAVWISNCAWLLLHFLVAYCIILYRPSGWECRTCGVGDNTVIVGGGRRLPWFERVLCEFVRVEGLLLCKSLGRGIFSQIPSKHPLLPRYVNSILRSIYRSSNTPIWTQTPLSKVGVLPLCRMGCLCSGTFWTGRNSWRKKSISMEFQNFHARVAEKFHPTFHLHKCIVPTYNLRERTDDSQADVTSSLLSQCLFSYINHEGITLVGKGNGVLPLRFRTQYLSRC
jgi:hypothetical protein